MPVLGVIEVLIGIGLAARIGLRIVLLALIAQMLGTFLVFVVLPDIAFEGGNPFMLTVEGEFVLKNIVLLSAAMVVGTEVDRSRGTVELVDA